MDTQNVADESLAVKISDEDPGDWGRDCQEIKVGTFEDKRCKVPVDPETGAEYPLILQKGNRLWFLKQDGTYSASVNAAQDFYRGVALAKHLKWAIDGGAVTLTATDKKGEERPKSKAALLAEYGIFIESVSMSLAAKANKFSYSGDGHLTEALCPLRSITPRRNPQIEEWLRLLGGDNHSKLLDWIATITQLDRPSAILLLVGEPGVGKGLLLEGLARLWGSSYTRLYDFVKKFNGAITHSPLVGVDEGSDDKDKAIDTKTLRSVSAQSQFFVEKKGADQVPAEGAVRILIACNDIADALKFNEDLNASSRDAVTNRFLVIRPDNEGAAAYLKQIGGRNTTDGWVRGDALAAHALWLAKTRQVVPGARFAVEAEEDEEFRSFISLSSHASVAVAYWLTKFLTNPDALTTKQDWIHASRGKLWVYADLFDDTEAWEVYCTVRHPGPATIAKSLDCICVAARKQEEYRPRITLGSGRGKKTVQPRFRQIDTRLLFQQAKLLGVGDLDAMRETLSEGVDNRWGAEEEHAPAPVASEAAQLAEAEAYLTITPRELATENARENMAANKLYLAREAGLDLSEEEALRLPHRALSAAAFVYRNQALPENHPLSRASLTALARCPF